MIKKICKAAKTYFDFHRMTVLISAPVTDNYSNELNNANGLNAFCSRNTESIKCLPLPHNKRLSLLLALFPGFLLS